MYAKLQRPRFRRTLIALCAECALCSSALAQAVAGSAADRDASAAERVVVTGSRAALEKSVALKKEATIVQDSISAEDMGRFADDSVADALGHITGVTVTRGGNNGVGGGGGIGGAGGEGFGISVRGLGPDFSLTLLNGRLLATDANTRNFAFDTLPSEVISGADVFKSARASHMEGAIGGVVNLKTARPLDRKGMHASIRVDGNKNDLSGYTGGKLSLGFSNTFSDDRFGVSLGFTKSKQKIRTDGIDDYAYVPLAPLCGGCYPDVAVNGNPTPRPTIAFENFGFGTMTQEKNRDSASATLEWRPVPSVRLAADALLTRLKSPQYGVSQSYSFGFDSDASHFTNATSNRDVLTGFDYRPTASSEFFPEVFTRKKDRKVDTKLFGFNGEWKISDQWTLTGDVYQSTAKRKSARGNLDVSVSLADPASARYRTAPDSLASIQVTLADGRDLAEALASGSIKPSDYSINTLRVNGDDVDDRVRGLTVSSLYRFAENDWLDSLLVGAGETDRRKDRAFYANDRISIPFPGNTRGFNARRQYVGVGFAQLDPGLLTLVTPDNFLRGGGGSYPMTMYSLDSDALLEALRKLDGTPAARYGNLPYDLDKTLTPVLIRNRSFTVEEKASTLYSELNLGGNGSWFGNVGLRYVRTRTTAENSFPAIASFSGSGTTSQVQFAAAVPTVVEATDSRVLPSANFGFWLQPEKLLLRVAAAKTMSRPDLGALSPVFDVLPDARHILYYGHPALKPTEANQGDLSLEWYYKRNSVLSAALFVKKVRNFVVQRSQPGESVQVLNADTNQLETFTTERPTNGDRADVAGFELGATHLFDNGFGVSAKYSKTRSKAYADGEYIGILPGVAPTASSLTLLYEKGPISAQVSVDHTSRYLDTFKFAAGGLRRDIRAMNWVGATFSYEFAKGFRVYFEGRNLSDASERVTLEGVPEAPFAYSTWGRTYVIGLRAQF